MSKFKGFEPNWYKDDSPKRSYRSIFKWGDQKEYKLPNERLYKMMKSTFDMKDDDFKAPIDLGLDEVNLKLPVNLKDGDIEQFKSIVGDDNVTTDEYLRLQVAYGKTMLDVMRLRKKIVENVPDCVIYPRNREDIKRIVAYCNENLINIYVYGGGSSVTRGVEATKGGITLDMRKNFNKVINFNEKNQTITVEAGMSGPKLEETLNNAMELFGAKRKYTCGHFPQSFEYSSVGGWVVTRGAGQNSTYYGKIEDIVISQEYVTPVGYLVTDEFPATATGPNIDQIMIGSEGAYGILTHVTLRVFRLMKKNQFKFSYIFKSWEDAREAAKEIMQNESGYPSVFRLSDPEETDVALKLYGVEGTVLEKGMNFLGYKPMQRCLFLGFTDGERKFAKNVKKNVKKICKKYGAMYLTGYPTKSWEHGRFKDPYLRDVLQDFGVMTDTIECSVTWDNMLEVHEGVREFCKSRPNTICMTHMSHVYPQGANLYFIFIAKMDSIEEYTEYQKGILDSIQKFGGSMSHHHGIGKSFGPWLEGQIGKETFLVYKALKNHFDPNNIMNPGGTLGLDLPDSEKRFNK
ncbi:FAD-binding oxidoreductase [Mycoplasmatota bacterium WC44]